MKTATRRLNGLALALVLLVPGLAWGATTRVWTGNGADALASTAGNWDTGTPEAGDAIVFDNSHAGNAQSNATWDLSVAAGSWTQQAAYTNVVTLTNNLTLSAAGGASGDLTVNGGTLRTGKDVESGITAAGTVAIGSGGTVVVRRKAALAGTAGEGQLVQAENLAIAEGGILSADGEGFDAGLSKGPGGTSHTYDGASHGGTGGDNAAYGAFHDTYGMFTNPIALGSGANGSAGGGAVIICAADTVAVNGLISADAPVSTGGAGSGGSINISAPKLAGTGVMRARGGNTTGTAVYGPGGGGRIAFHGVTNDGFAGLIQVHAGTGGGHPARPGTVWLSEPRRQNLYLGAGGVTNLLLGFDGSNNYVFGSVVIAENAALEIDAYEDGSPASLRSAVLNVDSLEVQSNGVLSATGRGFRTMWGPGKPGHNYDGAAHGGVGGNNLGLGAVMPDTYGSFTNPVTPGSGAASAGGGAVVIRASNTVTVNGTIAADSPNAASLGTGSGGSINITASILAGTGIIRACSGSSQRGTGGGGRIAFHGVTNDVFAGQIDVRPGSSTEVQAGRAGTVWLSEPRLQNLFLGAGGMTNLVLGSDGTNDYTFGSVVIASNGVLEMDAYVRAFVLGAEGATGAVGRVAMLNLGSLEVQSNGVLSAKARGFLPGYVKWSYSAWGPGFAGDFAHGASHGGMGGYGGTTNGTLRQPYGSIASPTNLGSGATSAGGGAIVITATGSVTVAGSIAADALPGASSYGAGAGGSVNIRAATLSGTGTISARGGDRVTAGRGSGGGGRIAVSLTAGTAAGGVALAAYGGALDRYGAAGSVYVRSSADPADGGLIRFDNNGKATLTNSYAILPGEDALPKAHVVVTNAGTRVTLAADAQYQSLTLHEGVVFNLYGRRLQVGALTIAGVNYRSGEYAASDLGPLVTDEPAGEGRLAVIYLRGTVMVIR